VAPRLAADAQEMLTSYRWPGNVRELKNVVERVVVRHAGREINPEDLPSEILEAFTFAPQSTAETVQAAAKSRVETSWDRMVTKGESFWTVVYPDFIDRELTKTELRQLIKTGLQRTQGSYRKLVELFGMKPTDYKRFLAFLYQHDCHLPFHAFREPRGEQAATS
jgi:DNA-binding NtrC family response regulator